MEAQAPKHWLDFGNTYQGTNAVHSMEYFTLWIRHLEKRIGISQAYLETISRREHPTGLSGIASTSNDTDFGMGETPLQDGEIREPEDPTSKCSEVWWSLPAMLVRTYFEFISLALTASQRIPRLSQYS
jgi:hypothetical protein